MNLHFPHLDAMAAANRFFQVLGRDFPLDLDGLYLERMAQFIWCMYSIDTRPDYYSK